MDNVHKILKAFFFNIYLYTWNEYIQREMFHQIVKNF